MEFLDFSEVVLTKQFLDHVCYGEPGDVGKGGHLSGMKIEGKSEFPATWDEDRIFWALRKVLEKPQYVFFEFPHIYLRRIVADVMVHIELRERNETLIPFTAYPMYGSGVVLNVLGKQHHIPHHNSQRGK
jgi:hypothetical protein